MRFLVRSWSLVVLLAATWCLSADEAETTPWLHNFTTTLGTLETDFKTCKTGLQESETALTDCKQQFEETQTELGKLQSKIAASLKDLAETRKDLTDSQSSVEQLRSSLQHADQHHDLLLVLGGAAVVGAFLLGWAIHASLP